MQIKRFPLGQLKSNCYIVHAHHKAYIVDPGYESQNILNYIQQHNLDVSFIYLTHGHPDHIGGVDFLNKTLKVPVYAPIKDKWWIDVYAPSKNITATITHWIKEPYNITFENKSLHIYDVPGHSEGGTILFSEKEKYLFSGDTLFFQTVGRTDIPYADPAKLVESIQKMYNLFPEDTVVYPGHGKETSIRHEQQHNPFVRKSAK